MADEEEPKGLYMSLDDIISENRRDQAPRGRGGRFRGEGRPMQQGRFDGGAARRQQYLAQRGRGRGEGQLNDRAAAGFAGAQQICFNCGEPGHIARECPNPAAGAAGGGPAAGGGEGLVGPCFACGEMGHIKRDCPLANGRGAGGLGAGMGPGFGGGPVGGTPLGMASGMGMGGLGGGMGMGLGGPPQMALEELRMQKMLLMQQQQELALLEQQQLQLQQQRQRQMIQQQQQPMRRAQPREGGIPDAYRKDQSCFLEEPSGDVVVRYKNTDIVRVAPSGDITLNTEGWYTPTTLASLNDALNVIGIRITAPGGSVHTGDWAITDGRALMRYFDGVVLAGKGPQHATRGRQLLLAFQNPNRSLAAAATAASNAAAAQAGIVPNMGYQAGGGAPGYSTGRGHGRGGGSGGVFNRLGGRVGGGGSGQNGAAGPRGEGRQQQQPGFGRMQMDEGDGARVRRLKAQGRYNPY